MYVCVYIYIYIKNNSDKPEMVHWYGPVSKIYRTTGQTDTTSSTVLTSLTMTLFHQNSKRFPKSQ